MKRSKLMLSALLVTGAAVTGCVKSAFGDLERAKDRAIGPLASASSDLTDMLAKSRRPLHLTRTGPPEAAGRWSLVPMGSSGTDRAHAVAVSLLERHGVVTRESVLGEGVPGGFASVYPVLRAMEDARTDTVRRRFERLFERHGLPQAIRSDNGSPFASVHGLLGLSRLSVW